MLLFSRQVQSTALPTFLKMEDRVGFEPTIPLGMLVFKTRAIIHSAIYPLKWRMVLDLNQNNLSVDSHLAGGYVAVPSTILKLGRPWMNRTPTARFGGEQTTIILTACRKIWDRTYPAGTERLIRQRLIPFR